MRQPILHKFIVYVCGLQKLLSVFGIIFELITHLYIIIFWLRLRREKTFSGLRVELNNFQVGNHVVNFQDFLDYFRPRNNFIIIAVAWHNFIETVDVLEKFLTVCCRLTVSFNSRFYWKMPDRHCLVTHSFDKFPKSCMCRTFLPVENSRPLKAI